MKIPSYVVYIYIQIALKFGYAKMKENSNRLASYIGNCSGKTKVFNIKHSLRNKKTYAAKKMNLEKKAFIYFHEKCLVAPLTRSPPFFSLSLFSDEGKCHFLLDLSVTQITVYISKFVIVPAGTIFHTPFY